MLRILILCVALALGGCTTLSYYWQSAAGQLDLWRRSQPIANVIAEPSTPAALKQKLELVLTMREFASRELALPDNRSYRLYADIERPFVVWNVFAAPQFSLAAKQWCFPVAGCVNYHGYFSRADAERDGAQLRAQGYDVHLGGVPAYSTLGYFDDPVLNTFVRYPDFEVARLIFHELAHQVVYAKGDSTFNESFAVTVEEEGVRRWIAAHGNAEQTASFERLQNLRAGFLGLIKTYRRRLEALYIEAPPPERLRAEKARCFADMHDDYEKLKASWGGWNGYDRWFAQGPNNASIVSIGLYYEDVPAFQALLRETRGDLPAFYARVRELANMPLEKRTALLQQLMPHAIKTNVSVFTP